MGLTMVKTKINIVSCNVNRIGARTKKFNDLLSYIVFPEVDVTPDIFALQEFRIKENDIPLIATSSKSKIIWSKAGLALGFKNSLKHEIVDTITEREGHFIATSVEINAERVTIVNVYLNPTLQGPPLQDVVSQLSNAIAEFANGKVIILGDFNMVWDPKLDQRNRDDRNIRARMLSFLRNNDFTDIWRSMHGSSRAFTFFHPTTCSVARLDYIFVSPSMLSNCISSEITASLVSDHSPVSLCFSMGTNQGKGYWRFPNFLLSNSSFDKELSIKIEEITALNNNADPALLWDTVKASIRGLAIDFISRQKKEKMSKVEALKNSLVQCITRRDQSLNNTDRRVWALKADNTATKLKELLKSVTLSSLEYKTARKTYWQDRPSKYFYNRKKFDATPLRAIYKKVKEDNKETKILVENDGEILEIARSFYERLYKAPDSMDAGSPALLSGFLNSIPKGLITEPHYRNLDAPISLEECRTALIGMKNDKCPGLDGLTKEFYIKYWPLVGQLVLDSLTYGPSVGQLSISQRRGVIRLVPKKNRDPREVENWRPITMLNVDYKILTRVLALRLQNVLPTLTHPDQKGFIRGRDGKENVLDTYSMISLAEELSSNHVLVLLDITKAFDSVSHNFIQEILHAYGMPPSFINWVKTIYARKEIRMINNGYMSTPFTPIRGTAQGCSLSPLLFVLAIEALGNSIRLDPNIQGFNVSGNTKKVAMLADDTLVGMRSTPLAFESLHSTLYRFGLVSGLKINESKCLAVPLGDKQTILQDATWFPGLQVCEQPNFHYMGIDIPYTWNEFGNLNYSPLDISPHVELIKDIIQPWNQWDVSILGRVDVIKSFAGSKFTYLFQLAPTPRRSSINKAQRMMDNFIWNSHKNPIASEIMKQPLKYGGIKSYHMETQK